MCTDVTSPDFDVDPASSVDDNGQVSVGPPVHQDWSNTSSTNHTGQCDVTCNYSHVTKLCCSLLIEHFAIRAFSVSFGDILPDRTNCTDIALTLANQLIVMGHKIWSLSSPCDLLHMIKIVEKTPKFFTDSRSVSTNMAQNQCSMQFPLNYVGPLVKLNHVTDHVIQWPG
jgi:hypothetical protein